MTEVTPLQFKSLTQMIANILVVDGVNPFIVSHTALGTYVAKSHGIESE